jgi:hypothetical protein
MPCASRKSRSVDPPRASARAKVERMRGQQPRRARPADAVGAQARVDAGLEQRFAGVDVARADDDVAGQQHGLDRTSPALQGGMEARRRQGGVERFGTRARPATGLPGRRPGPVTTPRLRTGAGRSGARCRGRSRRSKWSCGPGSRQGLATATATPTCPGASAGPAGPARRRVASSKGSHRYLPRRATGPTASPSRLDGVATQRPAQGFAQVNVLHPGAAQGLVDAAPGDLDFREFGHRTIM